MKKDTQGKHANERMARILANSSKATALSNLIYKLQFSREEIRSSLPALDATLGTNSARAAIKTIDIAIRHLRCERGNVCRSLASSQLRLRKVTP